MRVLVVKMSSLGDVIHTLPAISDAAAAIPDIVFDWVVEENFAEIPSWHPAVDTVIPIALRRWRKQPLRSISGPQWRDFKRLLRRNQYDLVIDAQGLLKSALVARLVKAPLYGMDKNSAREALASWFYTHKIAVPKAMHAVQRTRNLFAAALGYEPPAHRGDYGLRTSLDKGHSRPSRGLLFFHGTARDEKLWPASHWTELAQLTAQQDIPVWLPWGSEQEQQRAQMTADNAENAEVLPKLNLQGLANMLLTVRGAVAVDTGLAHLAAALDVPTVSLYGPTDTELIGAYGDNQIHLTSQLAQDQNQSAQAMMAAIEPTQVWQALEPILLPEVESPPPVVEPSEVES